MRSQPLGVRLAVCWVHFLGGAPALASRFTSLVHFQENYSNDKVTLSDVTPKPTQTEPGSILPSVHDIVHGTPGDCEYNGSDMYVLEMYDELKDSYLDPRNGYKELGFVKGTAQKVLQLARTVGDWRIFPLQLTGRQAIGLIKAQYGIMWVRVPRGCFGDMRRDLTIDLQSATWEQVKERRERTRWYLKTGLENACASAREESESERKVGQKAKTLLEAMYWGYWSIYEPRTSAEHSVIAVRVLDEKRFKKGDHSLRQIWHYGKLHMYRYLDQELRQHFISHPNRRKDEQDALMYQRAIVAYLQTLSNARIEYIDIDNRGSCISAAPNDPEKMLKVISIYRSSLLRTTIMWREESWKMFFHSVGSFFNNPFQFMRKQWNRKNDKLRRSYYGGKLGMVLAPILKGAAMAGLILGVMTGGAVTLPMMLAGALTGSGATALLTASATSTESAAILAYLMDKIFRAPLTQLQGVVQTKLMVHLETSPLIMKFWGMMDENDVLKAAIDDANLKLQIEVENILEAPLVRSVISSSPEEIQDGLEEEARRYAEGIIRESFVEEICPSILSEIEIGKKADDPHYGWLTWRKWRIYRSSSQTIEGQKIRYEGPDDHWMAKVVEYRKKRWLFSGRNTFSEIDVRALRPDISPDFEGVKHTVELTDDLKRYLSVYDKDAYALQSADWLEWNEWEQYHLGKTGAKQLKGKEVYVDDGPGCEFPGAVCAHWLSGTFDAASNQTQGAPVVGVSFKLGGLYGPRTIYLDVDGTSNHVCMRRGILVTRQMKTCLRIKDPVAYRRYLANREHHEQQVRWHDGTLGADFSIVVEVVNGMRSAAPGLAKAQDEIAEQKLLDHGLESATLDVAIGMREEGGMLTEDEELVDQVLAEGLANFDPTILDFHSVDGKEHDTHTMDQSYGSRFAGQAWLMPIYLVLFSQGLVARA